MGDPKGYFGILSNAARFPVSPRPTIVAITTATTIGMKERVLSSAKINSIANSTPPSGALKAAVIALAAPQPTSVLVSSTVLPVL